MRDSAVALSSSEAEVALEYGLPAKWRVWHALLQGEAAFQMVV